MQARDDDICGAYLGNGQVCQKQRNLSIVYDEASQSYICSGCGWLQSNRPISHTFRVQDIDGRFITALSGGVVVIESDSDVESVGSEEDDRGSQERRDSDTEVDSSVDPDTAPTMNELIDTEA